MSSRFSNFFSTSALHNVAPVSQNQIAVTLGIASPHVGVCLVPHAIYSLNLCFAANFESATFSSDATRSPTSKCTSR